MASTAELFTKAVHHHRYGNLKEAENMYRQVVELDPDHADAWNFIGFIALQAGHADEGIRCINRAISLNPTKAVYHANLGLANRAIGNAPESSRCVQEAKRLGLSEPKGYNSLGIRFMNEGNPRAAAACFELALEVKPDYADGFYNLGIALAAMQRPEHAVMAYERALSLRPDFVEAYNNLGDLLVKLERYDEAIIHLESSLRYNPRHAKAHYNLGRAWLKKNEVEKAEERFREVLSIRPDHAKAHEHLARILEARGQIDAANKHFTEATQIKPEASESFINAGISCLENGRLEEAVQNLRSALEASPQHAMASFYLGNAYQRLGYPEKAIEQFREAIRLQPNLVNAYYQLGDALANFGDCNESAVALEVAIKMDPGHYRAHGRLADCLERQGRFQEALARYDEAIRMDPLDPGLKIRRALAVPVIPESVEQVDQSLERVRRELDALGDDLETVEDPYRYLGHRTFFLDQLGREDRELHERIARIQSRVAPDLDYRAAHCGTGRPDVAGRRIRVGFLSKYFRHHAISKMTAGIVRHLTREDFDVSVLTFPHESDEWKEMVDGGADRAVVLADSYHAARDKIAEQELDILVYTDIGMDRLTYDLAFARLAPVQCVLWCHPVSTGIPNVDYFVSSRLVEPEDADRHYSETLERLSHLPMYYYRPLHRDEPKTREELALPADVTLYACPQNSFKIHPEFDPLIGEILRRDPAGRLILFHGVSRNWDELLKARFARTIPDVAQRVVFVRRADVEDFVPFLSHCDVILDPVPVGGGTTTFEALGVGTPVVTCPGNLMRSRWTAGCYRQMGLDDLVSETPRHYVEQALRWGTDPRAREQARTRILEAAPRLFDNDAGVRQLEDFFRRVVR